MRRAYAEHANSYLVKPVDFQQFVELMGWVEKYWLEQNHQPGLRSGAERRSARSRDPDRRGRRRARRPHPAGLRGRTRRRRLRTVRSLGEALQRLDEARPDLVITDLRLPDGDGAELLRERRERAAYPVVVMTAFGDQKVAVDAMRRAPSTTW